MKKIYTLFIVIVLTHLVFISMILPNIGHLNFGKRISGKGNSKIGNSFLDMLHMVETNSSVLRSNGSIAASEIKKIKKYNFQFEAELEKRERFERRKQETMYKLERMRARVFDKSIDINELFPPTAEEIANVNKYYNISERKLTTLNSKFLMDSKELCSNIPQMIVVIPSIPVNENIRRAIRSTYGSIARFTLHDLQSIGIEYPVKIAFLLGRSPNQTVETVVKEEQRKYNDIIQIDFTDSYYNLTLKILYGFKWVNIFCKGVKYVVKADEDVFVNIRLLQAELKTYREHDKGSVFGFIHSASLGIRVLRAGKWGVSKEEYPLNRYPPYAQGTSYTLTSDLIPKIIATAEHLPYMHIEDAFITGVIAGKILGAQLEIMIGNSYWTDEKPDPCEFVKTERVSQTNMIPSLMYKTWKALIEPDIICVNSTFRARIHRYNLLHRLNGSKLERSTLEKALLGLQKDRNF